MENIILLFIYLLLIAVNHFRYKFLLSGNAGEMILYFANVFFNPPCLIIYYRHNHLYNDKKKKQPQLYSRHLLVNGIISYL